MPTSAHCRRIANIAFLAAATEKLVPTDMFLVAWKTKPRAPICGKCLYVQRQMPLPAQVVNGLLAKALATLDCLLTQKGGC